MSPLLLDTNVLSELVRPRPEPRVTAFVAKRSDLLISALTLHEITYGAERARDPTRRGDLISWATAIRVEFSGRIVAVDEDIAERSGRLRAAAESKGLTVAPIDALIAASAAACGAKIATRNVRDFAALGVAIVNPWDK